MPHPGAVIAAAAATVCSAPQFENVPSSFAWGEELTEVRAVPAMGDQLSGGARQMLARLKSERHAFLIVDTHLRAPADRHVILEKDHSEELKTDAEIDRRYLHV
jgi:hypothetical protein